MRRALHVAALAIGVAGAVLASCSSAGDYEGGGRRTVPPGATDGSIGLSPVDSAEPDDTSTIDTNAPDTDTPDTNPFRPDTSPG
jgi:hypothetical protein